MTDRRPDRYAMICQKECQKMWQIECQKICQIECHRMSDRISNRMPDKMPEDWQDTMSDGMNWMPLWGSLDAKYFFYFVIFCYILFCIVLQCFALPRDDIVPRCDKFNSACRSRSRLILHGPGRPLHCELQSVRICDIVWCVLMFFASLPLDDMVPSSMHTPLRVFMGFLWFSMVFYGFLWFSTVF